MGKGVRLVALAINIAFEGMDSLQLNLGVALLAWVDENKRKTLQPYKQTKKEKIG